MQPKPQNKSYCHQRGYSDQLLHRNPPQKGNITSVHSKMEHLRFRHANQLTATPKLFMIRLHIAQLVKMTLFCASERRPTHPLKNLLRTLTLWIKTSPPSTSCSMHRTFISKGYLPSQRGGTALGVSPNSVAGDVGTQTNLSSRLRVVARVERVTNRKPRGASRRWLGIWSGRSRCGP